jgi:hypothetical protein
MGNPYELPDYASSLFQGLSGFWQRFFSDTADLEAFYQASEQYLGQVYLDLLSNVLSTSIDTTPVFNKESWKLFAIAENELSFTEGASAVDDRFTYDMPGTTVDLDVLQNSIVDPTYVLEKELDFETTALDGYLHFVSDPFRQIVDESGEYIPAEGVAWRWVNLLVGNAFYDTNFKGQWPDSTDVRRGNTLRLLAYQGAEVVNGTVGKLTYSGSLIFSSATAPFVSTYRGDVIEVYGDPGGTAFGRYLIKEVLSTTQVLIDEDAYLTPTVTSGTNLTWRLFKNIYYDYGSQDYEIDFFEEYKFIGKSDTPYPIDRSGPFLYSVIREPADDMVAGVTVNAYPTATDLGSRHLKVGTVDVFATRLFDGSQVQENVDFTVDYLRGVITPVYYPDPIDSMGVGDGTLTDMGTYATFTHTSAVFVEAYDVGGTIAITSGSSPGLYTIASVVSSHVVELEDSASITTEAGVNWIRRRASTVPAWDPLSSISKCSYQFSREVLLSANGAVAEQSEGSIKQLSFWVPEVSMDRFTLYNNYGAMLNRFQASSETYRVFLRGIMYLYVSGPILQRIESALNVAAGYPVCSTAGETLLTYDSGLTYSGTDGVFAALTTRFSSASTTFTSLDIGGYVVVKVAVEDINRTRFRVLSVIDSHTVEVEATYGVLDEVGMTWEFSRTLKHILTTETTGGIVRTYSFPYWVPMRSDLIPANAVTFDAFEVFTTAFIVSDYLIDPTWWHNKYIPEVLWGSSSQSRRFATTQLIEHVFDPADGACIDDPGLYLDAGDDGVVLHSEIPFTTTPVSLFRHTVAFILFDRYLKMHMFYVGIDHDTEFSTEFIDDITDLVLVAKPAYTYPYVEPGEDFRDTLKLLEEFWIGEIGFTLDDSFATVAKGITLDHDILTLDDYYRYETYVAEATGKIAPLSALTTFNIAPSPIAPEREYFVMLRFNATVHGKQVVEGRDYTIDLDPISASYGEVTIVTADWDAGAITFDAQTIVLYNAGLSAPNTTIGYTPLAVDGTDPTYLRDTVTEQSMIDRALTVTIDTGLPAGIPPGNYTYV